VVSLSPFPLVKSLIIRRVVILLLVLFILRPQLLLSLTSSKRYEPIVSLRAGSRIGLDAVAPRSERRSLDQISLHFRLQIIPLHLIATGLLLISILSFQSLPVLFPANVFGPLNGVLLVAFVYYLPIPNMPYFFLSLPSIIQRTIASFLLLFLLSSPQLLTFVGAATATVLVVLLAPQTVKGNYVVRRLHETQYADYAEAKRFIRRLSWSVFTLFWICVVTNWVSHYPEHVKFLKYPAR
jgi:hypothetical protein